MVATRCAAVLILIGVGLAAPGGQADEPQPTETADCRACLMAHFGREEKLYYAVSDAELKTLQAQYPNTPSEPAAGRN
jgi:hypothetical protein